MQNKYENSLDEALKNAFTDAEFAPPEHIWANIEKALPQAPLADGGISQGSGLSTSAKLLSGAGAVVLGTIAYLYLNNSSPKITKNETIEHQSVEQHAPKTIIQQPNADVVIENAEPNEKIILKQVDKPYFQENTTVEVEPEIPSGTQQNIEIIQEIIPEKINIETSEIVPKNEVTSITNFKLPEVYAPVNQIDNNIYFKNEEPFEKAKVKGGLLKNVKVRAGVRVNN